MLEKVGIGIDVVDVDRFRTMSYHSKPSFYKKIFLRSEILYCLKYKDQAKRFSGKFALKEAVKKSIPDKVNFLDIITSHSNSKPSVKLRGENKYVFVASITHEDKVAIAVVISEKV